MTKVPSVNYDKVIRALRRGGWVVVRQRGSHIRLQKHTAEETLKLTIPAIALKALLSLTHFETGYRLESIRARTEVIS